MITIGDVQEEIQDLIKEHGMVSVASAICGAMTIQAELFRQAGKFATAQRCNEIAQACDKAVRE